MKRLEVLSLIVLCLIVSILLCVNNSFSLSTLVISSEGDYIVDNNTSVKLDLNMCETIKDNTKNEVIKNSQEFKLPKYASKYLFRVSKNTCEIYQYEEPLLSVTCTDTHLDYLEESHCDLYIKSSNYGLREIKLIKNSPNLSLSDFKSLDFNFNDYKDNYSFTPNKFKNFQTKSLVGTFKVVNLSKTDEIDNLLNFNNIYIIDDLTSYKHDDINIIFKENKAGLGVNDNIESTTTKSSVKEGSTNIEYTSSNKNKSSKVSLRNIIFLLIFVIFVSISLGFFIVFFFKDK